MLYNSKQVLILLLDRLNGGVIVIHIQDYTGKKEAGRNALIFGLANFSFSNSCVIIFLDGSKITISCLVKGKG